MFCLGATVDWAGQFRAGECFPAVRFLCRYRRVRPLPAKPTSLSFVIYNINFFVLSNDFLLFFYSFFYILYLCNYFKHKIRDVVMHYVFELRDSYIYFFYLNIILYFFLGCFKVVSFFYSRSRLSHYFIHSH